MADVLTLTGVSKVFPSHRDVDNVNVSIRPSRTVEQRVADEVKTKELLKAAEEKWLELAIRREALEGD